MITPEEAAALCIAQNNALIEYCSKCIREAAERGFSSASIPFISGDAMRRDEIEWYLKNCGFDVSRIPLSQSLIVSWGYKLQPAPEMRYAQYAGRMFEMLKQTREYLGELNQDNEHLCMIAFIDDVISAVQGVPKNE